MIYLRRSSRLFYLLRVHLIVTQPLLTHDFRSNTCRLTMVINIIRMKLLYTQKLQLEFTKLFMFSCSIHNDLAVLFSFLLIKSINKSLLILFNYNSTCCVLRVNRLNYIITLHYSHNAWYALFIQFKSLHELKHVKT